MIFGVLRGLAIFFVVSSTLAAAQILSDKASSRSPLPQAKLQEVLAPYWSSEPGWDTELQLKNNLAAAPLTVTPVLRLASGEEIPLDPVTIASNASVSVWVNEGLLKHAPSVLNQPGSFGSVVFRFTSLHAMNLYATAVPSIQGQPIAFAVRARPAAPGINSSLEGIWWQPRSALKDLLIVSNSSGKKVNTTLWLLDAGGRGWSEPLSFAPHQTQRFSVGDLLLAAGLKGNYGGIRLEAPGEASALTALHFMYDETSQFSTTLEMLNRDPNATARQRTGKESNEWTTRAPLLALRMPDPELGLPADTTLQPTIFVRNTTAKSVTANLALSWQAVTGTAQVRLPRLQLPPFATQQLQMGAMQQQLGIPEDAHWATATLTTSAAPDDLIAIASSVDAASRFHLDASFSGTVTGHFVGGEWRADSNHDQLISVTNSGQKPTNALLTLHYDNGQKSYEMQQSIQPGDQVFVDVVELIRNRVADRRGQTLPTDLTFGTYDVLDLSGGSGGLSVGSLALDKALGYQAAVPSPDCCGDYGDVLSPDSIEVDISGFQTVEGQARNQCTGQLDVLAGLTSWWSGNSGVAQVANAKVTGVAPGYTTANASGVMPVCSGNTLYWENINLTAPVTVTPTVTITIQSSGTIPTANSARGQYASETGTYNLGNILDGLGCSIGYQATGTLDPSDYTGTVTLVRTKQGSDYDGSTGTTLLDSYPSGTDDSSSSAFEVTTPTSGVVYDLDAPFQYPSQNQIWRKRMNFFENAQLPDGTYVATEVPFYVRFSCKWGSGGSTFSTDVEGDNIMAMGTTKTSWNLQ